MSEELIKDTIHLLVWINGQVPMSVGEHDWVREILEKWRIERDRLNSGEKGQSKPSEAKVIELHNHHNRA